MLKKLSNEDYNYINRLRVRSFRAHNDISFEPGNASVLILGSNGVGKTSILEAIRSSTLIMGEGFSPTRHLGNFLRFLRAMN